MAKKYILKLTADERTELERLARRGHVAGWKIQRAQALLHFDQGPDGPAWTDEWIAQAYGVTVRSLESWRKRAVEAGPMALLERKARVTPATPVKLDGEKHARLTALACSTPPRPTAGLAGRSACWPSGWSNWRSLKRSRTRPSAAP
jgi:hypothetical protein